MIYQLIKRDRVSWMLTAGLCALFALLDWFGFAGSILLAGLAILLILNWNGLARRCTEFEAAMPIHGRDLLLARLLSDLALVWAPLLVILVTSPAPSTLTRQDADNSYVALGALFALSIFCIQSARVRQFAPPTWWQSTVVVIAAQAIIFGGEIPIPDPAILMVEALACCALLLRILALAPCSMQTAPKDAREQKGPGTTRWPPEFAWLPVLRTLFPWYSIVEVLALVFLGATGSPFLGVLVGISSIFSGSWRLRNQNRWLLAEPVSRPILFALIAGVPLLSYLMGCLLQPHFLHQSARAFLIDFAIMGSFSLAPSILAGVFLVWRRPRLFWLRLFLLAFLIATPEVIARLFWGTGPGGIYGRTPPIAQMLNSLLPVGLPRLIAAVGLLLVVLSWLAYESTFRRMEVFSQLQGKRQ